VGPPTLRGCLIDIEIFFKMYFGMSCCWNSTIGTKRVNNWTSTLDVSRSTGSAHAAPRPKCGGIGFHGSVQPRSARVLHLNTHRHGAAHVRSKSGRRLLLRYTLNYITRLYNIVWIDHWHISRITFENIWWLLSVLFYAHFAALNKILWGTWGSDPSSITIEAIYNISFAGTSFGGGGL